MFRIFPRIHHGPSFLQETQEKRTQEQQHQHQQQSSTTTTNTTTAANQVPGEQSDGVRREFYSEKRYNRTERKTHHRSPSESSDVSTAHGVIDEDFKKKYLRCLAYMKLIERLYENQEDSDDDSELKQQRLSRRV